MPRDYYLNGNAMVLVKGNNSLTPGPSPPANPNGLPSVKELGLTSESITITPRFVHRDFIVDDFGPNIPPEVMVNLAEVRIKMNLIYFDPDVLDQCMLESMAGGRVLGVIPGAGTIMGGYRPLYTQGNHYIGLNILSTNEEKPWFFLATYIETDPFPMEFPIGTKRSIVNLTWRAIPYAPPTVSSGSLNATLSGFVVIVGSGQPGEIQSSGIVLWNNTKLTPFIPGGLGQ